MAYTTAASAHDASSSGSPCRRTVTLSNPGREGGVACPLTESELDQKESEH